MTHSARSLSRVSLPNCFFLSASWKKNTGTGIVRTHVQVAVQDSAAQIHASTHPRITQKNKCRPNASITIRPVVGKRRNKHLVNWVVGAVTATTTTTSMTTTTTTTTAIGRTHSSISTHTHTHTHNINHHTYKSTGGQDNAAQHDEGCTHTHTHTHTHMYQRPQCCCCCCHCCLLLSTHLDSRKRLVTTRQKPLDIGDEMHAGVPTNQSTNR